MSRHHAHTSDQLVMALGAVVVLACILGIAAVLIWPLGGAA